MALCMLLPLSAAEGESAEVTEPNLKIGNYWTYSFSMTKDSMVIEGNVTMEIVDVDEKNVGGEAQDVFVLESSGDMNISGDYEDYDISGTGTVYAKEYRLFSNFDLAESAVSIFMDYTMTSGLGLEITVDVSMGHDVEFTPALNDYVGDEDIVTGSDFETTFNVRGEAWVEMLGENETEEVDSDGEYVMSILDDDVDRVTPAGSFACCRVGVECTGNMTLSGTNHFSVDAGNYVDMDEESSHFLGLLGEMTLVDYSYSPDGEPPVADAGENFSVKVGEEFEFNGTGSTDNVGVTNYTWTFAAQGDPTTLYGKTPTHVFESEGVYVVDLTVYDEGGNSATDSVTVTVEDEGVLAYITGDKMWVGLTLIAVLVAAVIAVVVLSRRKKAGPTPVPPPEQPASAPPAQEQPPPPGAP